MSSRRMRSLPIRDVKLTDSFWSSWQQTLVERTLPHQFEQLVETGRLANVLRAAGREEGPFVGLRFNDSDVYKYLEACAYGLTVAAQRPELADAAAKVRKQADECIAAIEAAQMPDGYLNSYFQINEPEARWKNLNSMHEMYC